MQMTRGPSETVTFPVRVTRNLFFIDRFWIVQLLCFLPMTKGLYVLLFVIALFYNWLGGCCLCLINVAFKLYQNSLSESVSLSLNANAILISNDFSVFQNGVRDVVQAKNLRVQSNKFIFSTRKPVFHAVTQNEQNFVPRSTQSYSDISAVSLVTPKVNFTPAQPDGILLPTRGVLTFFTQAPTTTALNSENSRQVVSESTAMEEGPEEEAGLKTQGSAAPPSERKLPSRTPKPHKYRGTLYFRPSQSGLGNNLYGLVSAFVISALSSRRLVGSWSVSCAN